MVTTEASTHTQRKLDHFHYANESGMRNHQSHKLARCSSVASLPYFVERFRFSVKVVIVVLMTVERGRPTIDDKITNKRRKKRKMKMWRFGCSIRLAERSASSTLFDLRAFIDERKQNECVQRS
jgi:hypothetical protein